MDEKIVAHLSNDPKLRSIIDGITPLQRPVNTGDIYYDLVRSIVFQQLSGKAASTIHKRFLALFDAAYPHQDVLQQLEIEDLRAVGLSRQKSTYIKNVAAYFNKNEEVDWVALSDEDILKQLTQIKGVGKWTVQMILMFTLERPDVFPVDDLGIQTAIKRLYELESSGKALKTEMINLSEPWRPYRSYACRYLWHWVNNS